MVTGSGAMLVATGTQIAQSPLQVLLVGEKEEDFFLIREILERNSGMLAGGTRTCTFARRGALHVAAEALRADPV